MTNIIPKTDQYVSYKISKNIEIGKVKNVNGSEIITESIFGLKRIFTDLSAEDVVAIKEIESDNYIDYEV